MSNRYVYYVDVLNATMDGAKKLVDEKVKEFKEAFPDLTVLGVARREGGSYIEKLPD